jgi:large subunit ribosomal protein L4
MGKLNVINLKGEKVKDLKLNEEIFNITPNDIVAKKALDLQLASLRQGTHKTKNRAEVSGGGRKPYKQKGTGNARQGSIRAPHYRGGGIVHGVTPDRNYTIKMNKKERVLALRSVLSYKAQENKLVVIDSLEVTSLKTKDIKEMLKTLKLEGKVLFITSSDAEKLYMGSRNLAKVNVILANEINVFDILNADVIVVDEVAMKNIEEVLK